MRRDRGRCGTRVVSVDYRLSPDRHPAAYHDALAATRAVAQLFGGPLVLAGDSAGGCLAAAVVQATRGEALGIVGQVLIYAGPGGDPDRGCLDRAHAPMLTRDDVIAYGDIRFEGGKPPAPRPHRQSALR